MKSLGKQMVHIYKNGESTGKTEFRVVYKNANGDYFVNYHNSKKIIKLVNSEFIVDYIAKTINSASGLPPVLKNLFNSI